jgi:hypothetical protein
MTEKDTEQNSLSKQELAQRIDDLETDDKITVNNHEQPYRVVSTETYSVIVETPNGHKVTISQNLQTGGWQITETVRRLSKL